jgi:hypothetical protein
VDLVRAHRCGYRHRVGKLTHELFFPEEWLTTFARAQAINCAYGNNYRQHGVHPHHRALRDPPLNPQRSVPVLLRTFVACSAALAICGAAVMLGTTHEVLIATGYGILVLACVTISRRFGLGLLGIVGMVVPAFGMAILLVAAHPAERGTSVPLAFAGAASPSLTALSERVLDDAPLVGTGAGTFAALAAIYREIDDPPPNSVAATAAPTFAIELGKPMLWLIAAATAGSIFILLGASLQRGRDSFYPAMGGSCLITLLLLSFKGDARRTGPRPQTTATLATVSRAPRSPCRLVTA